MMNQSRVILTMMVLLMIGCSQTLNKEALLKEARYAYTEARTHPETVKYAQEVLQEAEQTLQRAEKSEDESEIEQLAYIAQRQAQIALALAERKIHQSEREQLIRDKDKLLLKGQYRGAAGQDQNTTQQLSQHDITEQFSALKKRKTQRGWVLTLQDMLFESGKADLLSPALDNIQKVAAFLKQNPTHNVIVEGHTDSVGDSNYNLGLSQRRADEVRFALVRLASPQIELLPVV
ncbi:MAG: OmpA family protein [Pseudomonadota bacterium]|nr:OmpA family protein [Pseudomonadota bacterium]